MSPSTQPDVAQFPSTTWTLVESLKHADADQAFAALERLLRMYHQPLHAFIIRKFKVSDAQAEDWLHNFVWKKVIVQELLTAAQRSRGKFRTFLATALSNFITDEIRLGRCKIRAPSGGWIPLDEASAELLPDAAPAPQSQFDLEWGQGILQETFNRMQAECEKSQRPQLWRLFELRLLNPILHGAPSIPYLDLCGQLGYRNDVEAGNALITAKRMFARFLRSVIREYARDEAEVEAEITELMATFNREG